LLIIGVVCAYLIGAVPFAYIFTKWTRHRDIREEGSKNVGATNVLRIAGKKTAILVLILDILKGVIVVSLLASFFAKFTLVSQINIRLIFAASAVVGHIWPIYLKFNGGKGVATTLGSCLGLSFYMTEFRFLILIAITSWFFLFFITRYVSIGSMVSALSLPITAALKAFDLRIVILCLILATLVIFKHHENIKRLITKRETRLYFGSRR
jgi:glycerol-3-phosphate acyltransferase PlsY